MPSEGQRIEEDLMKKIRGLPRFRTPSLTFDIVTNGGLHSATLAELWGPPRSGKSTFAYNLAALAKKDLQAGTIVFDIEMSLDPVRMLGAFDMQEAERVLVGKRIKDGIVENVYFLTTPIKVPKLGASPILVTRYREELQGQYDAYDEFYTVSPSGERYSVPREEAVVALELNEGDYVSPNPPDIETAFEWLAALSRVCNKPTVVIYDSIAVHQTRAAMADFAKLAAGGITEKPRVLKAVLSKLMSISQMYNPPLLTLLINQVHTEIGTFTASTTSGGGFGLKHNIHYSLEFFKGTALDGGDDFTLIENSFRIVKSKFSIIYPPEGERLSVIIDEKQGGVILRSLSFLKDLINLKFVKTRGGWYYPGWAVGKVSGMRLSDLTKTFSAYQCMFTEYVREHLTREFPIVKFHYEFEGILLREPCYNDGKFNEASLEGTKDDWRSSFLEWLNSASKEVEVDDVQGSDQPSK